MANFILKLTFPIIFNVIALTVYLTSEKDTSLLPILFINLAYFALIIVPSKIAGPRKEKVLSWTIYLVSWGYFLTEFLVGIILLVVNTKNTFLSFSIQLILLGIYVVVVSASHIANIHTERSFNHQAAKSSFIDEYKSQMTFMLLDESDIELKKYYKAIVDKLDASPQEVNPLAQEIEVHLRESLKKLQNVSTDEKKVLCELIIKDICKRNNLSM